MEKARFAAKGGNKVELKLCEVTKKIGKTEIIDHVSCIMESGKVYGLKGYNGSGKTMLMRLISGLIIPTSGDIYFDGKSLGKEIEFPSSMGLLIESPGFLDNLTAFNNLNLISRLNNKASKSQIYDALVRVGLDPQDKRKYRKFSLGMKQRLGIAAVIFERPDLILLDEPSNALDADGISLLKKIIIEEKSRGSLVIVSCHEAELLSAVSDVIFTIEQGRIVGSATQ